MFKRVGEHLAQEYTQWPVWIPVFLGSGIALYFSLHHEPDPMLSAFLLGLMGTLTLWAYSRERRVLLSFFIFALLPMILGFNVAIWRTLYVASPVLTEELTARDVLGQVVTIEPLKKKFRLVLEQVAVSGLSHEKTPDRIRLVAYKIVGDITPGRWVRVRAVLTPPSRPVAPGAYDFARASYFKKIGAVGFAVSPLTYDPYLEMNRQKSWVSQSFSQHIETLRFRVGNELLAVLPVPQGAIAQALITGDRSSIPEDSYNAFRASGLAHLLAISGLHVGLVVGFLFFLTRFLLVLHPPIAMTWPTKKIAAVIGIIGALFYMLLAGSTPPTVRSFFMMSLVFVGILIDRQAISMRAVSFAAFVILLFNPEFLISASFQLSFAAVVALIAFFEHYYKHLTLSAKDEGWVNRFLNYVLAISVTTLVAGTATAPLSIYHFNQYSTYGMLTNLIAIPLTALLIMPMGFIGLLLMPIGLHVLPLKLMGVGISWVDWAAKVVTSLPYSTLTIKSFSTEAMILITLGGLWFCFWHTRWRLYGIPAMAIGTFWATLEVPPDYLIEERGKLIAERKEDGYLYLSSARTAKFVGENWCRMNGQKEIMTADTVQNEIDVSEEDLRTKGCHAYWRASGQIVTVQDVQGNRPWTR